MEALQELFDLYEKEIGRVRGKPQLMPDDTETVGTPDGGDDTQDGGIDIRTPAAKKRDEVDALVVSGMPPEEAYIEVMGPINLADSEYKAGLAACLARHDKSDQVGNIHPDPNGESIFAKISRNVDKDKVTPDDLKTPGSDETPDVVQKTVGKVAEEVVVEDETCYADDVDYLRKYGRA